MNLWRLLNISRAYGGEYLPFSELAWNRLLFSESAWNISVFSLGFLAARAHVIWEFHRHSQMT